MTITDIKQELEKDHTFQYWSTAINLTFEDFDIVEIDQDIVRAIQKGKKDIGQYTIFIKNNEIDVIQFGFGSAAKQHINKEME